MSIFIKKKFIGNNEVDGAKILLLNSQALRAKSPVDGSSVDLLKFSSLSELELIVQTSIAHAPSADSHVANKFYVDSAVSVETRRAQAREAELQFEIDAEEARAQNREAQLQAEIDILRSEIDAEEARAQNREAQLQAEIYTEETRALAREAELQAEIYTEETRALAREAELQAEIDAEEARALYVENELGFAIQEETAARIQGDEETLVYAKAYTEEKVAEVVGDAGEGYNTLGKIEDKIEFIMSNTDPAALDSLTEIVSAYQAADSDIYTAITNLNGSNAAAVQAERDRALVREAQLQAEIDAEEARAQAREAQLQAEIDAEEARALAREAQLQAEIDAEETRAQAREAQLQAEIDAEEVRAQAREAELQAEIDAEEIARENAVAAEAALRMAADEEEASIRAAADEAEAAARQAADEAEAFARMTADDALDARLDVIEGDATVEGSVAKAKADAKAYTDSKVAEVVGDASAGYNTLGKLEDKIEFIMSNTDPAALDSLTELLAAYQAADSNVYNSVATLVEVERQRAVLRESELQFEIDAEEARALAAEAAEAATRASEDAAIRSEIALEAQTRSSEDAAIRAEIAAFKPMAPVKYTLTAEDIMRQGVELAVPYSSLVEHSVIANVDRLYLLPEELVASPGIGGNVFLSFAGAIAAMGEQALEQNDVLTIRYWVR